MPDTRVDTYNLGMDPLLQGPIADANLALSALGGASHNHFSGHMAGSERAGEDLLLPRPYSMPVMPRCNIFGDLDDCLRTTSAPSTYFDNITSDLSDLLHSRLSCPSHCFIHDRMPCAHHYIP